MNKEYELINLSVQLATKWQKRANELTNSFDEKFHNKMKILLSHPKDKALLIELMDQSFRTSNSERVADQINFLFEKYGMASFFSSNERLLLWLFQNVSVYLPEYSVPFFIDQIRQESKSMVIEEEEEALHDYLTRRKFEHTRVNLNLIGEVVLGEIEAKERIDKYLEVLKDPHIDYISIKISTLYSQINVLDFESTVEALAERLSMIYEQAQLYPYVNEKGLRVNKFINLDMEEYRDLDITVEVFKRVLNQEKFKKFYAGIVLQAYLPDSFLILKKLTQWANTRVDEGGSPIKVRIVKGANMQMELTEASHQGWSLTTYNQKIDTDANYKKMVRYGLDIKHAPYVHIGTASHNLFEQAFATIYAKEQGTSKYHTIEMLEGMSESARLAIKQLSKDVIVYAPVVKKEQFTNAIGYLVRRLDENTQEGNFIRYSFGLDVNSVHWKDQKEMFIQAFIQEKKLFVGSNRQQNRLTEQFTGYNPSSYDTGEFHNEPDTDFILKDNRTWAKNIINKWKFKEAFNHKVVPVVVNDQELINEKVVDVYDKSQEGVISGRYTLATKEQLNLAIDCAKEDKEGFSQLGFNTIHALLKEVAINIRNRRGDLIGVCAAEVGKVFTQTDVEVSESVDFLEFYPHAVAYFEKMKNLNLSAKGVGLVVAPWNFPIAIVLGGIAASLSTGNRVLVKPSSGSVLSAYELCKCFWDAGFSKKTLQFLPCNAKDAQNCLIKNDAIDFVIFTGSEDTAAQMLKSRNDLCLSAETGGKNATIVTAMADREQAIKNVCQSAFANSGQKCSATSLLILEKEVYEDDAFKKMLLDSANSMSVGSVWDLKSKLSCLALPLSSKQKEAIENLEEGESWLIEPKSINGNNYFLRPCIKYGVKEGSFTYKTELFAPILAVMKAENLDHAINMVNATDYGLTSGLESLDEREIEYWKENIIAGNLYINRGTTGAIVLRQPFGGLKASAVGSGRKVGFYNYITQFLEIKELTHPKHPRKYSNVLTQFLKDIKMSNDKSEIESLEAALQSYLYYHETEFSQEKSHTKVRGEDNSFRYLKLNRVAIRVSWDDSLFEVLSRILAARVSKVNFTVSIDKKNSSIFDFLTCAKDILFDLEDSMVIENSTQLSKSLKSYDRIIYSDIKKVPKVVFKEAAKELKFIIRQKPMMDGRLELLNYFNEQSISYSFHRYGNLGVKEV